MPITSMDIVASMLDNKPAEVSAGFHELMMTKINDMVNTRRREVATNLFGAPAVTTEPEKSDNEEIVADTTT